MKKTKAGILTYNSAHNYGAVLQCFALQEYLKSIDVDVEVINYRIPEIDRVYKVDNVRKSKIRGMTRFKKLIKRMKVQLFEKWRIEKFNNFERFINESLNTTKPFTTLKDLRNADFDFDIMFAGSDQIWNPQLTKRFEPAYFLEFGKKKTRRASYAASLGTDEIDPQFETLYKRYLKNLDFISVREETMVPTFQEMTNKKVNRVLDPTLLLEKSQYEELMQDSKYKNDDYIYVHYIGKEEKVDELAEELSKKLGLPIVHNRTEGTFSNELGSCYSESPEQFLSVIANAKYVLTNSFHATVFALVFEKDFITIPHNKRPGRMKMLLEIADLENHLIGTVESLPELDTLTIDYKKVKENFKPDIEFSKKYIDEALHDEVPDRQKDNYFYTKDKWNCYGCELCVDLCPVNCIEMTSDKEGFIYPVIDENTCTNCGICKRECIYKNGNIDDYKKDYPKVYVAIHKDNNILDNSTSGGIYTELFKDVIGNGGYVVGVRYDEEMLPEYAVVSNLEDAYKFRGSKYVFASIKKVRFEIKELLENDKLVLFTSSPCQVAALRKFLKKDYSNLLIADLICHGVPSQELFKSYLNYLEKKYNSKVIDFKFRDKTFLKNHSITSIKVTFENGKEILEDAKYNNFNRLFLYDYVQRPGCYVCEFAGYESQSDVRVGDYWGLRNVMRDVYKANRNGISCITVNTEKGEEIFNKISDNFNTYESNIKDMYTANHKFPMVLKKERVQVMERLHEEDINAMLQSFNKFKNSEKSKQKVINNSL